MIRHIWVEISLHGWAKLGKSEGSIPQLARAYLKKVNEQINDDIHKHTQRSLRNIAVLIQTELKGSCDQQPKCPQPLRVGELSLRLKTVSNIISGIQLQPSSWPAYTWCIWIVCIQRSMQTLHGTLGAASTMPLSQRDPVQRHIRSTCKVLPSQAALKLSYFPDYGRPYQLFFGNRNEPNNQIRLTTQ